MIPGKDRRAKKMEEQKPKSVEQEAIGKEESKKGTESAEDQVEGRANFFFSSRNQLVTSPHTKH